MKPWYFNGLRGIAAAFMILAFQTTVVAWTLEPFTGSLRVISDSMLSANARVFMYGPGLI